jgi:hypothetical protein
MDSDSRLKESFHSWKLQSGGIATKKTDKSTFLHHGTAIPEEIHEFFQATEMADGDKKTISLAHASGRYSADLTCSNNRIRLFWKNDFADLIQKSFSEAYSAYLDNDRPKISPRIKFQKSSEDFTYLI